MNPDTEDLRPALYLFSPQSDFVRPYFERFFPDFRITDEPAGAQIAIMISSTDIYDVESGADFNELTPVKTDSAWVDYENRFLSDCRSRLQRCSILRCAPIVATGMQGWPRRLAEAIYRGTFVGLSGNDARRSVVHAVSLPVAARALSGKDGIYNVTDGVDPPFNDLAEALAWRIAQKRLFYIPSKWFRLIFGKRKFAEQTNTLTFSCEKIRSNTDYNPVSTVEYLRTHIYDESSL